MQLSNALSKSRPVISVAMIVKNESHCIETCLKSVSGADEIVVVDTGSSDSTVDIAQCYTKRVFSGEDYLWSDDFAKSRNQALDLCVGNWVLSIDADEALEPGGMDKIHAAIAAAGDRKTIFVWMQDATDSARHKLARVFRKETGVVWVGLGHETIAPFEQDQHDHPADITIFYGSSAAHKLDPDRMLRILSKAVEEDPTNARNLYYLAREHYYRKAWDAAVALLERYLQKSTFQAEMADAHLMMARCLWSANRGNEARAACTQAVLYNPDCKEALTFMATVYFEPWKHKWLRLAEAATNEDVLFIR
jgi:glycosyltransferase involved in cell wall biosynthesis